MKKHVLIVAVLVIGLSACAKNPPKAVSDTFNSKFTNATNVKWDQESDNEWEAEFKMNNQKMSATFSSAGKWMETESEMNASDLPEKVTQSVNKTYAGWKIEGAEKISSPEFEGFELGLKKKGEEETEIMVSTGGKITVKQEEEGEENEEGEEGEEGEGGGR